MSDVVVRPLREDELDEADRIFRLAFGTFLRLPDPMAFAGDADYVRTRWRTDRGLALAAELDGRLVGSNFLVVWGTFGFFGPVSVRPELWNRGVAKRLLERTMEVFAERGATDLGLFTFAESGKHVGLYGGFGFHPRFLTPIMTKPVAPGPRGVSWLPLSALPADERATAVAGCRDVAAAVLPGLDPTPEIEAIAAQGLGDTVLLPDADGIVRGFALCHVGAGTEAGSGACFVKFGAVRPGAIDDMSQLMDAVEAFASVRGAGSVVAGVNTARERAWRLLVARGFRTLMQGVAMHRPNAPLTSYPDAFVLDDWR